MKRRNLIIAVVSCVTLLGTTWVLARSINSDENITDVFEVPVEIQALEKKAEDGDTAALHSVIDFYSDKYASACVVEVAEVIDPDGNVMYSEDDTLSYEPNVECAEFDSIAVIDGQECAVTDVEDETAYDFYGKRLDYWLAKGFTLKDPYAYFMKGMSEYYAGNEPKAITYLSEAALGGNAQAALFCGSAYFNEDKFDDAIKYLKIADQLGVPSAGWHIFHCYEAKGDQSSYETALKYLRKSAEAGVPEAIEDMHSIEPNNPKWK